MKWDYYVNHYEEQARQKKDSKMTWRRPSGDLYVEHLHLLAQPLLAFSTLELERLEDALLTML